MRSRRQVRTGQPDAPEERTTLLSPSAAEAEEPVGQRLIRGARVLCVPQLRVGEAATLLGVSDDTVRRWADQGRLSLVRTSSGRLVVDGAELAELARELGNPASPLAGSRSARNRLRGIVTKVTRDTVMAQVELQAGPFRVVSLMSREAADDLGLEVGTVAVASIKATNVVVERDADA